jgi:hypothetical protein
VRPTTLPFLVSKFKLVFDIGCAHPLSFATRTKAVPLRVCFNAEGIWEFGVFLGVIPQIDPKNEFPVIGTDCQRFHLKLTKRDRKKTVQTFRYKFGMGIQATQATRIVRPPIAVTFSPTLQRNP